MFPVNVINKNPIMTKYSYLILFVCSIAVAQNSRDIYFDFDIDKANRASLEALDQWIADNKDYEVTKIYGYTDTIGNALYNIDLSERRARYVENQLRDNNIMISDNLEIKGFGESSNKSSLAGNRHVIIHFDKKPTTEKKLTAAVIKAGKGDKLKLPGLNFYNNSARVLPESRPVLEELLSILEKNPKLKIEIQGHICCQPVELEKISYYRAKAIYEILIKNGIDKSRLTFTSFGSSRPVYPLPEKDESQRIANRRVEIEIIEN